MYDVSHNYSWVKRTTVPSSTISNGFPMFYWSAHHILSARNPDPDILLELRRPQGVAKKLYTLVTGWCPYYVIFSCFSLKEICRDLFSNEQLRDALFLIYGIRIVHMIFISWRDLKHELKQWWLIQPINGTSWLQDRLIHTIYDWTSAGSILVNPGGLHWKFYDPHPSGANWLSSGWKA